MRVEGRLDLSPEKVRVTGRLPSRSDGRVVTSDSPVSRTTRHRIGRLVLIVLIGFALVAGFARQEDTAVYAAECQPWEALVEIAVWSAQSAEWDADGQLTKASARYACVHTDQLQLQGARS